MAKTKWKTVDDDNVRHTWECTCHTGVYQVMVGPDFYMESGTPTCEACGRDMEYVCTEICSR